MTASLIIFDQASRQRALDHISQLSLEKRWELHVDIQRRKRTRGQNALYWAWCDEVAKAVSEYTGYEKEEIHEFFKQRFLEPQKIEIEGLEAVRYTTTKLDTKEMAEYTDRVYRWATSELGLVLPLPPVAEER